MIILWSVQSLKTWFQSLLAWLHKLKDLKSEVGPSSSRSGSGSSQVDMDTAPARCRRNSTSDSIASPGQVQQRQIHMVDFLVLKFKLKQSFAFTYVTVYFYALFFITLSFPQCLCHFKPKQLQSWHRIPNKTCELVLCCFDASRQMKSTV